MKNYNFTIAELEGVGEVSTVTKPPNKHQLLSFLMLVIYCFMQYKNIQDLGDSSQDVALLRRNLMPVGSDIQLS